MVQQIRGTLHRRSLTLMVLPLVAVFGATCTSCASPGTPQSSTPMPSVSPEALADPGVAATAPEPATGATASTTSAAAKPPTNTETTHGTESSDEISPLASSGAGSAGSSDMRILPSSSLSYDAATTELFDAVKNSKLKEIATAVRDGADLEAKDSYGRTSLMRAVIDKDVAVAQLLLEHGADPNSKDDFQDSAYLRASAEGLIPVLAASIEHGAILNSTNHMGSTALSVASENGQVESVRLLLQHDVPVNHVNDLGWTALHEAIVLGQGSSNYVSVARLLLLAGADPMLKDHTGNDALELATERGQQQMAHTIRSVRR